MAGSKVVMDFASGEGGAAQIWFMCLDVQSDALAQQGCAGGIIFAAVWAESAEEGELKIRKYLATQDILVSAVTDLQTYDRASLDGTKGNADAIDPLLLDELEAQLLPEDGWEMWSSGIHVYDGV